MRKDTRPSPCFTVLEATESWVGPGYEARNKVKTVERGISTYHPMYHFSVLIETLSLDRSKSSFKFWMLEL